MTPRSVGVGLAAVVIGAAALTSPPGGAREARSSGEPPRSPSVSRLAESSAAGGSLPTPRALPEDASDARTARSFVAKNMELPPDSRVVTESTAEGTRGGRVVRIRHEVDGVPVLGGEAVVDLDRRGRIRSAFGETTADGEIDTGPPATAAAAARRTALAVTARENDVRPSDLSASPPTRWIHDPRLLGGSGLPVARQVWRVEVTSPTRPDIRQLVLVDAATGAVALTFSQVADALERRVCDNEEDHQRPLDCTTPVRVENAPPSAVQDVNLAYEFSGDTYVFFRDRLGRDSLDDAGLPLLSTVRFCPDADDCPYANAFWNGQQMTFGTGYASADDVVGHELVHGVTEYTSSLFYYYQSGAINESLSDIFGEFVDLTNAEGDDSPAERWLMGEDLGIGAIRDMADPPTFGDPDGTGSELWSDEDPYSVTWDNGGVHSNSGVGNKFAALLTDGSDATDGEPFNGTSVTGVGIPRAARIIYHAALLLTSGADYQMFASTLRQSCQNLVGTTVGDGVIGQEDCRQVDNAIAAVGMDTTPTDAPIDQAPVCPVGQEDRTVVWRDDFADPGSGSWESTAAQGDRGWFYDGQVPPQYAPYGYVAPKYTRAGPGNLWGDDPGGTADIAMAMTADVPVSPAGAFLRFGHAYQFDSLSGNRWDGGVVEYSIDGGGQWRDAGSLMLDNGYDGQLVAQTANPLAGRSAFAGVSRGYTSTRLDLTPLAGQSVRFRFRIGADATLGSYGWFVDDFAIYTCATDVEPSPTPTPTSPPAPTPVPSPPPTRTPTPIPDIRAPGRVRSLDAKAMRGGVRASWRPPRSDGGSPVRTYRVRVKQRGEPTVRRSTSAGRVTVRGLARGKRATVIVSAVNGAGAGPATSVRIRVGR